MKIIKYFKNAFGYIKERFILAFTLLLSLVLLFTSNDSRFSSMRIARYIIIACLSYDWIHSITIKDSYTPSDNLTYLVISFFAAGVLHKKIESGEASEHVSEISNTIKGFTENLLKAFGEIKQVISSKF